MNALGKATVGLTVLGGEYLVYVGPGSCDAQAAVSASIIPLWRLNPLPIGIEAGVGCTLVVVHCFSPALHMEFGVECVLVPIHTLQPAVTLVAGVTFERLIPFVWDAAILIDFADEVTYPLIVVNEAVEPTPTNTISIPTF